MSRLRCISDAFAPVNCPAATTESGAQQRATNLRERMNGRGVRNGAGQRINRGVGDHRNNADRIVPMGHYREASPTPAKSPSQNAHVALGKALETIDKLKGEIETLYKKVAFLKKIDLSVLNDGIGNGDVTFIIDNAVVIKAHQYILVSKSSIFKKMFESNMTEKCSGEIHVDDVTAPVLRGLIQFLYTAEVKFTDEVTAAELFKVAHKYDITELQAECETELFNIVSEENLAEMIKISYVYGIKRLKTKSAQIFRENFDRVHETVINDLLC